MMNSKQPTELGVVLVRHVGVIQGTFERFPSSPCFPHARLSCAQAMVATTPAALSRSTAVNESVLWP